MIKRVAIIGLGTLILGLALVPLPGPGWPIVQLGAVILVLVGITQAVRRRKRA